jgi:2-iminobutanoate/2-iminopropanoate deaminase
VPNVRSNPDAVSPPVAAGYSQAVRAELGDATLLFVSGQLPLDVGGALVGIGDPGAQARQVFENLRAILAANGATFADVVKLDTFVTDLAALPAIREVRRDYLGDEPPASTLVEVSGLVHPDASLEVDLVAVVHRG